MISFGNTLDIQTVSDEPVKAVQLFGLKKPQAPSKMELAIKVKEDLSKPVFNSTSRFAYAQFENTDSQPLNKSLSAYETIPEQIDFEFLNEVRMEVELKKIMGNELSPLESQVLSTIDQIFQVTLDQAEESDDELDSVAKSAVSAKMLMENILSKNG